MKLHLIGCVGNWFLKNNYNDIKFKSNNLTPGASKTRGFVLTIEVLIVMIIVAFVLTNVWQGAITVMNFNAKIKRNLESIVIFENYFDQIANSGTTWHLLIEKNRELSDKTSNDKNIQIKAHLEEISKKSELYSLFGKKFAYLSLEGSKEFGVFKVPVFIGRELEKKDQQKAKGG